MTDKHGIVIVTYNRLELLKECLRHVELQTIPYDEIFVIDNCSTDNTYDYLIEKKQIRYTRLQSNQGGAGGFSIGLKQAYLEGCSWITLIDDDAILDLGFHGEMKKQMTNHKDVLAFGGRVCTNGNTMLQFARRMKKNEKSKEVYVWNVPASEYAEDIFLCDAISFCGCTVASSIIDKIGYPDKSFFISHDDTEYCMRIRSYSNIGLATKAIIDHQTSPIQQQGINWKQYYSMRNQIFELKKHFGYSYAWKKTQSFISQRNKYVNDNAYVRGVKKMMLCAIIDAWRGKKGRHRLYP